MAGPAQGPGPGGRNFTRVELADSAGVLLGCELVFASSNAELRFIAKTLRRTSSSRFWLIACT
jgi:hypothetical protein